MAKYTCELKETVIETRVCTWDEKRYQELLDWLKEMKENEKVKAIYPICPRYFSEVYDVIAAYTWDSVLKYLMKKGDPEDEPIIIHNYYDKDGSIFKQSVTLTEYIQDCMREDACECEIKDRSYMDAVDYDFYEGAYHYE